MVDYGIKTLLPSIFLSYRSFDIEYWISIQFCDAYKHTCRAFEKIMIINTIYDFCINPFMISVSGDFNAKSNNWCKNDITSNEGSMIDAVTSNYGLHQQIQEPTHILNSFSSCIDLIFTSQPHLVMESGVYSSLYPSCHHQVVFAKFPLSILYPPYERTVWFHGKANPELIRRAINEFDWTELYLTLV